MNGARDTHSQLQLCFFLPRRSSLAIYARLHSHHSSGEYSYVVEIRNKIFEPHI